ncbi:MAG TPA: glycosyltransferase family 4 protein [Candidatus Andersenbacteria bacterium]|nr:glycosyltransferase family 4 protein [Candidatus Andersenbacteria bacterium]
MIICISSRHGGPHKQLGIIAKELTNQGYPAKHVYSFWQWIRLHFDTKSIIISSIPFFWIPNKKTFICNIRGDYTREKSLFKNPLAYLYSHTRKYSQHTVFPSRFLKNKLGSSDGIVIPNAITSLPEGIQKDNEGPVRIATVTSFDFKEKSMGVFTLLKGLAAVQTTTPFTFDIYGGGRYLESVKKSYEEHKEYYTFPVVFHGYRKDISERLQHTDIFLYWSTFDNMPNALLEALGAGIPIIANNYGAFLEILGDTNVLVHTTQELSESIRALLENPSLRIQRGVQSSSQSKKFFLPIIIQQWIHLITNL